MATPPLRLDGPSPELTSAPTWRREPYLLLFPLGALLAWAGVLPWLLFALGAARFYLPMFEAIGYRAAFHPIAQVEGFLTCFAVGFLYTFIPRRTGTGPPAWWQMMVALAAPFAATFFLEHLVSVQLAFALRAAISLAVVIGSLEALQPPTLPGLHRRVARWSVWMLPAGYLWVTVAPEYRRAGLHLVFLGCFTVLVLAVSTQVALSHGGRPEPLRRAPWQLVVSCALVGLALIGRVLLEVDPPHFHLWLGASAAAFLTATVPWAALAMARRPW